MSNVMIVTGFAGLSLGLIVAAGACAWLLAERRALRATRNELQAQRDGLRDDLANAEAQIESYRGEIRDQERQIADVKQQLAVAEQTHKNVREQFDQAQQALTDTFQALAGKTLKQATDQFLQLAKTRLDGQQKDATAQLEQRKHAIQALVNPIRETLAKHDQSLGAIEQARKQAYGSLSKQIELMAADQRRLRTETANLVQALRKPNVRGRWGQTQLRRVAELAGMIPHCDFIEEHHVQAEGRALRPDLVVNLPSGRAIVVDAKTPLEAFLDSLESVEDDQRMHNLKRHADQLAVKVKDLASKRYHAQFERSPDFVVLFLPGESFLYAALDQRPDLSESAMEQGVVIATPNTLISLLKVVALGWREQQIAENARRVSELGRELHERLGKCVQHLHDLGSAMETAARKYNALIGSFEARVLPSARKFEELGSRSGRALPPSLDEVATRPRRLRDATPSTASTADETHDPASAEPATKNG